MFLNTAGSTNGCRVYDLTANPRSPSFLFNTGGTSRDCHDSYVRENIDGKDVLFVSDGRGRRERFYDVTNVDSSWPAGVVPPLIGSTASVSGIYDHESWLSEDNRYLYVFDEGNAEVSFWYMHASQFLTVYSTSFCGFRISLFGMSPISRIP